MLKIATVEAGARTRRLLLSGSISGEWVPELSRCCDAAMTEGYRIALDLGDVQYADPAGLELLARLKAHPVPIVRLTPFLAELLAAAEQKMASPKTEVQ